MRRVEAGFFLSFATGRIGRGTKFPLQFGQTPPSLFSTQSQQNVHSNVHIMASVAEGGNSLSQHSQLGRNSSIVQLHYSIGLCGIDQLSPFVSTIFSAMSAAGLTRSLRRLFPSATLCAIAGLQHLAELDPEVLRKPIMQLGL
jgi:hypothetical protein